jgi:hypothetical protein
MIPVNITTPVEALKWRGEISRKIISFCEMAAQLIDSQRLAPARLRSL